MKLRYLAVLVNSIYAGLLSMINPKIKVFDVKLLITQDYRELYEQTHDSLATDLKAISMAISSVFNSSAAVRNNGYIVNFSLSIPVEHELMLKMTPAICEGAITNVTSLLNDLNNMDNTSHYIVFLPCIPRNYVEVFNSVNVDVPIVEHRTNVECSKRVAIFFENNFSHLMAAFGNALLKVINAPVNDYVTLSENAAGDDGVKQNFNINDSTAHTIINSQCFLNT